MTDLSIIIPTYNRTEKTNRAITSALVAMDCLTVEAELIIVDDGSNPRFNLLREHVRDDVTLISHEDNKGVSAARNTGIRISNGEILTFLDSDDAIIAETLAQRMKVFGEIPLRADKPRPVLACGWQEVSETGKVGRIRIPRAPERIAGLYAGCWFSPGSCCLYDRQWFDRIDGFDEKLRRLEDYDWFVRYAEAGGTLEIADLVSVRIEHGANRPSALIFDAIRRLHEKYALGSVLPRSKPAHTHQKAMQSYLLLEAAASHFTIGRYARAFAALARSFIKWPRFRLHLSPGWDIHARSQQRESDQE